MTVGIDIRVLARGTRTGVEEYTINLLENMLPLDSSVKYKLFYNGYKKVKLDYNWLKLPNVELVEFGMPNRLLDFSSRFFNFPQIDKLLGKVDVFFSPHIFLSSVSKECSAVITFHDLSFERHPEFYSISKNYWHFSMNPKSQAQGAKKIIAVSQSTKSDLIELYNVDPGKIRVVYSGVSRGSKLSAWNSKFDIVKRRYGLPDRYILYLGTLEPRKNIVGLVKAFEKLKANHKLQGENCKLVIAGSKGWLYQDVFESVERSPVKNDIIFTGFVRDEDKSILYSLADLFVYPSFYEGFGFPPLEAMANGTAVITSNLSSLPEAVGDAAIMINPYNLDELLRAIEAVLFNDDLRNHLIERGYEHIKKFSWQKCARETLEILKSV